MLIEVLHLKGKKKKIQNSLDTNPRLFRHCRSTGTGAPICHLYDQCEIVHKIHIYKIAVT